MPSAAPGAGVAELVDALGLGSSDASRGGSSPSARTILVDKGSCLGRWAAWAGAEPKLLRVWAPVF
jgi:hypothetical protein